MTDYLFPVELEPMADDEIARPDYEGDAEEGAACWCLSWQ